MSEFLVRVLANIRTRPAAPLIRQIGPELDVTIGWGDFGRHCERFAAAYRRAGLAPAGQVFIFLPHRPEIYGAFFGAMFAGLTPAYMPCLSPRQDPAVYWASHRELFAKIRPCAILADRETLAEMRGAGFDSRPSRIMVLEDLGEEREPLDPGMAEDAIALLQHSSGTTGLKKGVALSHRAIARQLESYAASIEISPSDVIVSWLPLYHDMGLVACLLLPAWAGLETVHIDAFHWLARPGLLFELIAEHRGTLVWLPNFAFEHLCATAGRTAAAYRLGGVRAFISCSEMVRAATMDRFAAAFAPAGVRPEQLHACYAMAEAVFAVTQTRLGAPPARLTLPVESLARGRTPELAADADAVELHETGSLIDGIALSVRDESGAPVANGVVGEIALEGEFLLTEYNKDPETTAERLRGGVYSTGDLGFLRDGRLYVLGRLDDVIVVNGRNIFAHEVEARVSACAGVKPGRAVAFGQFDPRVGSEVLIVQAERWAAADVSEEALRETIANEIVSVFGVAPRDVEIVPEGTLIKTTSGKLSRTENKRRHGELREFAR